MSAIVTTLGVFAAMIGLISLTNPWYLVDLVNFWRGPTRFRLAVGVRLVVGIALLVVAPACRLPVLVQALGGIAILAAIVILIVGQARLDAFLDWWLSRPPAVLRVSALFALVLGALLIYAGG